MGGEVLSVEALAVAVREPVERVRHWLELGLLGGDGATFPAEAVERARLISFAVRRGITAEAIAGAGSDQHDIIGRYLDMIGSGQDRPTHSPEEAARAAGLDEAIVRRLWVASGLGDQPEAFDEDLEMLRVLAFALGAGMPIEALLQLTRVLNDALTRVADTESRLFHFYVHERLRSEGLTGAELDAATAAVSTPLLDLVEPAVLYFHRKAWERALREDLLLHLAEEVIGDDDTIGRVPVAVLFVDLASFTPLTEVMGDVAAAAVIDRFSELVREAASEGDGRVLKQIGDEFMLVFPSATQAVICGVSIMTKAAAERQFPDLRLGAHAGDALYREGDYLGATVNLAARVTAQATRGQFLITDAVHRDLAADSQIALEPAGRRTLKGVSEPVDLFEVITSRQDRPVDPVCGMVIDPDSSLVRLEWRGSPLSFCSEGCRDRFVADPQRYGQPASS